MRLSTAQVFAASDATLSQCSTTGGQSLAIGVPHIYVNAASGAKGGAPRDSAPLAQCSDVFTEAHLIPNVSTGTALLAALEAMGKERPPYSVAKDALPEVGVPLDGEREVLQRVKILLMQE